MKSEATKFMKDKEANDCGEASPKIILSDENLKTSAGGNERSKMQNRAAQHKRKVGEAQEEVDTTQNKKQQQPRMAQIFSQGITPRDHNPKKTWDFKKSSPTKISQNPAGSQNPACTGADTRGASPDAASAKGLFKRSKIMDVTKSDLKGMHEGGREGEKKIDDRSEKESVRDKDSETDTDREREKWRRCQIFNAASTSS